ncbi:MAG: hypothetical protein JJU46_02760 [Balneolaceae bacterium]|nr:hypothetical protein [Balneolaceae bacterium]MCH8549361.1 6-bladed beta-propeller [Balneolaceae bacterium]
MPASLEIIIHHEIHVDKQAAESLHSIYPIASSSTENEVIALANLRQPVGVTLIDFDGQFIDRAGSEGRGPEEVLSARYIGLDVSDNIVINDKAQGLIKTFDRNNGEVKSHQTLIDQDIDITSRDLRQCEDHWILSINHFEYAISDTSTIAGRFDDEFRLIEPFGQADPFLAGNRSILQDPVIAVDCSQNRVYSTHLKIPFIQIFDLNDGSKIARIEDLPPSFKLSDQFIDEVQNQSEYFEFLIEEQSVSLFPAFTEELILLVFRNDTEAFYETRNFTDRDHFIAAWNADDFTFMGEIPVEGAPLGVTKEGYLITLMNDEPNDFRLNLIGVRQTKSGSI